MQSFAKSSWVPTVAVGWLWTVEHLRMWLPISVCPRKCWYLLIKIHGVASQNTVTRIPPWEAQIMKMRKVKCLGRTEFGVELKSVIWILKRRQQACTDTVRLCRPTWRHSDQELRSSYRVTSDVAASGRDWVRVPSRSRGRCIITASVRASHANAVTIPTPHFSTLVLTLLPSRLYLSLGWVYSSLLFSN